MVDHTFLFTGAVKKIRQLLDEGALGKLYYYDSTRVNLGLFQHDVNVIWDLAPHDLSIMDHLIEEEPEAIVATGQTHLNGHRRRGLHHALFPEQDHCPHQCELAVPGEGPDHADRRREEDAGLERSGGRREDQESTTRAWRSRARRVFTNLLVNYRSGDMWAPQIEQMEACARNSAYFVDCITNRRDARSTTAVAGLRVVKMLEAANKSLQSEGERLVAVMNALRLHRSGREAGQGRQAFQVHQSLRLRDRRRDQDRRLRRDSEERDDRQALQDFQPHLHLRRRDHRRQRLHRARSDVHQRHLPAGNHGRRRTADRGGLES